VEEDEAEETNNSNDSLIIAHSLRHNKPPPPKPPLNKPPPQKPLVKPLLKHNSRQIIINPLEMHKPKHRKVLLSQGNSLHLPTSLNKLRMRHRHRPNNRLPPLEDKPQSVGVAIIHLPPPKLVFPMLVQVVDLPH
jgi:hypothetical protein